MEGLPTGGSEVKEVGTRCVGSVEWVKNGKPRGRSRMPFVHLGERGPSYSRLYGQCRVGVPIRSSLLPGSILGANNDSSQNRSQVIGFTTPRRKRNQVSSRQEKHVDAASVGMTRGRDVTTYIKGAYGASVLELPDEGPITGMLCRRRISGILATI